MFSRFMSLFNGGMRAYKVQNSSREKRVGVTAKSFQDLQCKGREKLQVRVAGFACTCSQTSRRPPLYIELDTGVCVCVCVCVCV